MTPTNRFDDARSIAPSLIGTCFDADRRITGLSEVDATLWSKANSVRHAHTVLQILRHARRFHRSHLKILNASGLACGHQDFSVAAFLREQAGLTYEWVTFESPDNSSLSNPVFQSYRAKLGIEIRLQDFRTAQSLYGDARDYDVALFTEIAEHLDHSVMMRSLMAIRERLGNDGILIFTSPNLVSLVNRIRIFLGNGDGPYWEDERRNYDQGRYGHVILYDMKRAKRLLRSVGFEAFRAYTFTFGYGPVEKSLAKKVAISALNIVAACGKNLGSTLFIAARKSAPA